MTYIPFNQNLDAFGRLRVSDTGQRLDVEFLYDKQEEYFDEITGGTASVVHDSDARDLVMAINDTSTSSTATMSSHPVPYTPGNSQLIDITGTLNGANLSGGTVSVFLRSKVTGTVTEESYDQSSWDALTSGRDWSDSFILAMDFQSLKVGTIKFHIVTDGAPQTIKQINNDNKRATGYWQLPNLPAYYRIWNDTSGNTVTEMGYGNEDNAIGIRHIVAANASQTMRAICCTVKSEGGLGLQEMAGLPRAIDVGETEIAVAATLIPLLSIRPKATFNGEDNLVLAMPKTFKIVSDQPIRLVLLHDCDLTGASWGDVETGGSVMEYDTDASAVSNGHVLYADYVADAAKNSENATGGLLGKTVLWNRLGGETGILTIAAIRTTGSNADVLVSLGWDEIR